VVAADHRGHLRRWRRPPFLCHERRAATWPVAARLDGPGALVGAATVEKRTSFSGYDTGHWGKCVFGGSSHTDPGTPSMNVFQ